MFSLYDHPCVSCRSEAAMCVLFDCRITSTLTPTALSNYTESRKETFANKFKTDVSQWKLQIRKNLRTYIYGIMACKMMGTRVKWQHGKQFLYFRWSCCIDSYTRIVRYDIILSLLLFTPDTLGFSASMGTDIYRGSIYAHGYLKNGADALTGRT